VGFVVADIADGLMGDTELPRKGSSWLGGREDEVDVVRTEAEGH